jgi:hypothetical protein
MRCLVLLAVVAGFLAVAPLGPSAVQAADSTTKQGQNQWRYTFHNGEWWYWLPTNRGVYWRDSRWNDYKRETYISPRFAGIIAAARVRSSYWNDATSDSDIGPFYGRTLADLDRRPLEVNDEVGPFYGRTLPSEIFNIQPARSIVGPFYGRSSSSNSDR